LKPHILITFLTLFATLLQARPYCYDIESSKISSNQIELLHTIDNLNIPDRYIKKVLERNLLFAKVLQKRYVLNENDREYLKLKLAEAMAKLYIKKRSREFEPTEDDIKSFYIDHKDEFKPSLEAELYIMAIPSLPLADSIKRELTANIDKFEELAKRYSIDGSAIAGGYIGYTKLEKFPYALRNWIETTQQNGVSEPIKAGEYWFILKLDGKRVSSTEYKDLKPAIKMLLKQLVKREKMVEEERALKRSIL